MKLTQQPNIKRNAGMTLIELTVVILVLLALIAVLFVGAKAYKEGADKSACIMNIRNIQQAMRSESNLNNGKLPTASWLTVNEYFKVEPSCPSDKTKTYTYADQTVPAVGIVYAVCAQNAKHAPAADDVKNW